MAPAMLRSAGVWLCLLLAPSLASADRETEPELAAASGAPEGISMLQKSQVVDLADGASSGTRAKGTAGGMVEDEDEDEASERSLAEALASPVVINEVFAKAVQGYGEWIELHSSAPSPVDLSGWSLVDRVDNEMGSLAGKVIAPGGFVVVSFRSRLNNGGDDAILRDPAGRVRDSFTYRAAVEGKSFARVPDGGDWKTEPQEPSKGESNVPCDQRTVVINEVMPNPAPGGGEWVELYNPACKVADLAGWRLEDKSGNSKPVEKLTLAPSAYLVVHFNLLLNNGGDVIRLQNAAGEVVDSFEYTASTKGKSYQRAPGPGGWYPSPAAPSVGSPNAALTTPAPSTGGEGPPCGGGCRGACFGTWNIQNFGPSKGRRPAVMEAIRQVLSRYDVVAIQELSQMPRLPYAWCGEYAEDVICRSIPDRANMAVKVSPRIGDEQFAVIYKTASVDVEGDGKTYPDPNGVHSRPPHAFDVRTKQGEAGRVIVAVTHTTPRQAEEEIANFPEVTSWMEGEFRGAQHFIIAGDFNADGSYFSDERLWPNNALQPAWRNYVQLTDNSMDTTVSANDHTYDRIVADRALGEISGRARVYMLENLDLVAVYEEGCRMGYVKKSLCRAGLSGLAWKDFPASAKVELAKEISDHHPVEVCLG